MEEACEAVKVSDLKQRIEEMSTVNGADLEVPLTDEKYKKFFELFDQETKNIAQEGEEFLQEAKEGNFTVDFS